MKLPLSWVYDYTDIGEVSPKEFSDALTLSGSKVESFETEGADIKSVIVGRVESLERHPDSDHLWICQINVGGPENIQIVTGAQNLKEGDIVPVAMDDSYVAGGHHIKKGKLRGYDSEGMLCSGVELGVTEDMYPGAGYNGLLVFPADTEVGADVKPLLGLDEWIFDVSITANRPDCQSIYGLAREVAAALNKPLKEIDLSYTETDVEN